MYGVEYKPLGRSSIIDQLLAVLKGSLPAGSCLGSVNGSAAFQRLALRGCVGVRCSFSAQAEEPEARSGKERKNSCFLASGAHSKVSAVDCVLGSELAAYWPLDQTADCFGFRNWSLETHWTKDSTDVGNPLTCPSHPLPQTQGKRKKKTSFSSPTEEVT
ncbi:hypothetical protein MHYP_G00158160 [Metynnis hypsauchen]